MSKAPSARPVAVIGAGLTGASWAALFAAHGREVRLCDIDPARAQAACARVLEMGRFLVDSGLAAADEFTSGSASLVAVPAIGDAVADVEHVQECVSENLESKRSVFAEIDAAAPIDAIIATSSSGLSITDIQAGLRGAGRTIAAHPYNPPHLVPLVELAPGAETAPEVMERAREFYQSVGKDPVVMTRDVPGYLANRMSAALWREAIELVRSGVASVADVDRAISSGPGLRWAVMGPHLLYHLGGGEAGMRGHVEHLGHVKEGMLRDIATWTAFPSDTVDVLEEGLGEVLELRAAEDLQRERDEALAGFIAVRARAARLDSQPRSVVVGGAEGELVPVAPGVRRATLASGESTMMVRFELSPGSEIPMHAHPHEQTGMLVSGDLVLVGEEGEWPVEPGDGWSVPGRITHGARSSSGAVAVEVFSPVRVEYLPGPPARRPRPK